MKHVSGETSVRACWDVVYECANRVTMQASACQDVTPGQTVVRVISFLAFSNQDQCDEAVSKQIANLKITDL